MSSDSPARTIALVDWTQLLEDYLDNIGVSFESFCNEMTGGWMFGYIEALKTAGVKTVLFCVSARVRRPTGFRHSPTGATVCLLPAPIIYRALRRRVLNPYAATVEEAVGEASGVKRLWWSAVKDLAPYLSTPPFSFARELRRYQCRILLCQDYEHGRFDVCLLVGRLLRLPVFAAFQGGSESPGRLEKFFRRRALRASRGLIIPARSELARVVAAYGMPDEKLRVIFNPVDLNDWTAGDKKTARDLLAIAPEARVAVWHGRVDFHRKGLDVLLRAWSKVCRAREGRDLRLFLIGTGNDADELRREIAELKPPGLTWIDEYVSDHDRIRRYLSAADIYVFPSRHEGFAVAPLEAMACGLPVVAAAAPGVKELLEDGEDSGGIIVGRGDVEAFAAALGGLLDDETLGRQMGERARRTAEKRFSLEAVGAQLDDFLFSERANR